MKPMKIKKVAVGPELKDLIKLCFHADQPLLIEGDTGIGKSEVVMKTAQEMSIDCTVLDLTLMEPVDLIGMPKVTDNYVTYVPPGTLPTGGQGILFLDEINRAGKPMQNASLQLLSARRLNQYSLPKGWVPCRRTFSLCRCSRVPILCFPAINFSQRLTVDGERSKSLGFSLRFSPTACATRGMPEQNSAQRRQSKVSPM